MKLKTIIDKLVANNCKLSNLQSNINRLPKLEREYANINYKKLFLYFDRKEIAEKKALQKEYDSANAKKFKLTIKEYIALEKKAKEILGCFYTGHSMGCYRELTIKGKTFCTNNDIRSYAKSCTYKPTYGRVLIDLSIKELRAIQLIGGIPTIKLSNDKIANCISFVGIGSKQSYYVDRKEGYLTKDYHADTLEDALRWRRNRAKQALYERAGITRAERNKTRFIGFNNSLKVGNYRIGTEAFAQGMGWI